MNIIIVDDHILFREGIAAILRPEADIKIVGMVGSVREAVEAAYSSKPDVVLMDFHLPDGDGTDATRKSLKSTPPAR